MKKARQERSTIGCVSAGAVHSNFEGVTSNLMTNKGLTFVGGVSGFLGGASSIIGGVTGVEYDMNDQYRQRLYCGSSSSSTSSSSNQTVPMQSSTPKRSRTVHDFILFFIKFVNIKLKLNLI